MEGAQLLLFQVIRRVIFWIEDHGLYVAVQKPEIVLLTMKHINTLRSFILGDAAVQTKSADKHLGRMLDNKFNFGQHIIRETDKAVKVIATLGTLMANVNAPRPCMRRLLRCATEAVLLYGAEVCAEVLRYETYRKRIVAVQKRGALRISCSYCTVSEPAVIEIAGLIPINLLDQGETICPPTNALFGKGRGNKVRQF
ncbi:uncharacterized protein LOC124431207 [Vespa crabro]|uniref:uncharacterized protein LOC124431207 n=1 Tax=Vespa crabro TaxID=7445 RepID=UPI001F002151|nr:uncharacterized protein LOC124431207 [Vespa crabro]